MRKNSSQPSGNRPGPKKSFNKTDSKRGNADSRPFKKSDDRQRPAGRSEDRPFRKDKPAFDRPRNDERAERRGKWDADRPEREERGEKRGKWQDADSRPFKKSDDRKRPSGRFEDKPFKKDRPAFGRPRNEERGERRSNWDADRPEREERGEKRGKWSETDRPSKESTDSRPFRKSDDRKRPAGRFEDKPFKKDRPSSDRPDREERTEKRGKWDADRPEREERGEKRGKWSETDRPRKEFTDSRPFRERQKPTGEKPFRKKSEEGEGRPAREPLDKDGKKLKNNVKTYLDKKAKDTGDKEKPVKERKRKYRDEEDWEDDETVQAAAEEQMPLNKYIAHSGECSRRDAADMVKQGKVKVNGELMLDPGYKVKDTDMVTIGGKKLQPTKGLVYLLLNKPKGFITTNEDPQGRKTVMELVANSGVERLFPVGRLDRATTGLLLITNDGDLTQKLSHPSYNIKKVYHVTLDKPLTKAHFEKIVAGVELEDGVAVVDALAYLEEKNELGLEIHSGRNRIVRRIFESLGYVVEKLDRVMYAGLTKKNLPRGKWRTLDAREIVLLKHFKS